MYGLILINFERYILESQMFLVQGSPGKTCVCCGLARELCRCPFRRKRRPGARRVPSKSCRDLCMDRMMFEFSCEVGEGGGREGGREGGWERGREGGRERGREGERGGREGGREGGRGGGVGERVMQCNLV